MIRSTLATTSEAAAPVAISATPARTARSTTARPIVTSTPSGWVHTGIGSVGGSLARTTWLVRRRRALPAATRPRRDRDGRRGGTASGTTSPNQTAAVRREGAGPDVKPWPHGGLRRRGRPGHHEYSLHGVRPRRQGGGPPPARARADPAAGRVGGARPPRDLGADQDGRRVLPDQPSPDRRRHRQHRDHQPARDHRCLGQEDGSALHQRDRLAGHPHRLDRQGARRRRTRRHHPAAGRPGPCAVLLGRQAAVDARERRRPQRTPRPTATPSSAPSTPGWSGT